MRSSQMENNVTSYSPEDRTLVTLLLLLLGCRGTLKVGHRGLHRPAMAVLKREKNRDKNGQNRSAAGFNYKMPGAVDV